MKSEFGGQSVRRESVAKKLQRLAAESWNFVWFPSLQSLIWRRMLDNSGASELWQNPVSGERTLTMDDASEIGLPALNLDYFSMIFVAGLVYSVMNNVTADRAPVSYLPSVALFVLSRYVASPAMVLVADTRGEQVATRLRSLSAPKDYYDQVSFGTDKYDMGLYDK